VRQSVQFPMLVKSENLIRGRNKFAIYGDHEAQRQKVLHYLTTHIVKPRDIVLGEMNRYAITLCRISAGFLDSEDNLTGAFKHVRDAVGRWLGFKNDSDKRLSWKYQQQECPKGFYAIRVTLDDDSEGDEREIVVGKQPPILGAISDGCHRAPSMLVGRAKPAKASSKKSSAKPIDQQRLPFRRSFIAYPWDLPESASPDDIVATERHDLANVERPPPQLVVRIPRQHVDRMLRRFGVAVRGLGPGPGPRLVFERLEHEDPAMGGACWLYMPVEADG